MNRPRETLGVAAYHARAALRRSREAIDRTATAVSPRLHRSADALSTLPFRAQRFDPPGGTIMDDLVAYTQLDRDVATELVCRRRPIDFRGEWHATPPALRSDHWFYLTSKTYLFANASHFADTAEVDAVAALLPPGGAVLEFGAGVGNLALALAERGHEVIADEVSTVQRDFLRFRAMRHGLSERVRVIDPWMPAPQSAVDSITAFDVLEHLPDGRATLDERLLPALRPGGVLVENSPFVVNVSNPMHHDDWGLDEHLRGRGLALERVADDGTRVWRREPAR